MQYVKRKNADIMEKMRFLLCSPLSAFVPCKNSFWYVSVLMWLFSNFSVAFICYNCFSPMIFFCDNETANFNSRNSDIFPPTLFLARGTVRWTFPYVTHIMFLSICKWYCWHSGGNCIKYRITT